MKFYKNFQNLKIIRGIFWTSVPVWASRRLHVDNSTSMEKWVETRTKNSSIESPIMGQQNFFLPLQKKIAGTEPP